jgi:AraC family transcriptional regulator
MKILEPATYLGTRTSYQPGEPLDTSFHAHVNPHLTLLLQGGTLEKRQRGQYERRTGDAVFFHAGEGHQNSRTLLPSKNINLEFGADFLHAYGISEAAMGEALKRSPDTPFLPLRVYTELQAGDACSAESIAMLVLNVLGPASCGHRARPPWVRQVEEMLGDCWNQPVSLPELATAAGVHPVTLSKCFPRYFGSTLGQYLRKLRISRALALIQNTPLSLTQVAYECGFYDQIHFTRTFRQCTGMLPKAFKKM